EFPEAVGMLARLAEARHDLDAALTYSRRWLLGLGLAAEQVDRMAAAAAADGWPGYWRAYLGALQDVSIGGCLSQPVFAATVHMLVNEPEAALDRLEEAVEARVPMLAFLGIDLRFVTLRGHPRFQAILDRVGVA
ncbi:MAG TPA: hypothetical protein VFX72_07365, partial [Usitatibacteraceae bacterium]|nr:hypothetical protein [Usitatibacteraceae bacterium]